MLAALPGVTYAQRDTSPTGAFFDAIAKDDVPGVKLMMLRGISPNIADPELGPALVHAARNKAFGVFKLLAEYPGVDVNGLNKSGESALMFLAMFGEQGLSELLVRKGAIVNKPDWTALHYAAMRGNSGVIEFLLDQNAYIDAASENGTTPLMMAARFGQIEALRTLVARGADPSLRNDAQFTAADYLRGQDRKQEAQWLEIQAAAFLRRYGTQDSPVKAPSTLRDEARARGREPEQGKPPAVQVIPVKPQGSFR